MDVHRFAQGMLTDNDSDRLAESALPLRDCDFSIAHVEFVTISRMCKRMKLASKGNHSLVLPDNLLNQMAVPAA